MAQMDKNTVSSANQVKTESRVKMMNPEGSGKRFLFVGNSITLHNPKPDIGWEGAWGMAASEESKDYVHVLAEMLRKRTPDPVFCVCQVAAWEREYTRGTELLDGFCGGRDFAADVIVMRLIENCPKDADCPAFREQYGALVDYLNKTGKAQIVVTSGFWKHPGDASLETVAKEKGAAFVYLGDLGEQARMRADGLFWHGGVAAHPGDAGMSAIAERINAAIVL